MKNINKTVFGFTSLEDFVVAITGYKAIVINFWLAFIAAFSTFITKYVWDEYEAVFTLLYIMLADWFFGLFLAMRAHLILKYFNLEKYSEKELEIFEQRRFRSTRIPRILITMIVGLVVLAAAYNLSKHSPAYYILPSVIYAGIAGTFMWSIVENCAEYKIISKEALEIIKEKLNPLNWLKK